MDEQLFKSIVEKADESLKTKSDIEIDIKTIATSKYLERNNIQGARYKYYYNYFHDNNYFRIVPGIASLVYDKKMSIEDAIEYILEKLR